MNYFVDVLTKKYAQFDGRARRAEYWFYTLFNLIISIVCAVIDAVVGSATGIAIPIFGLLYGLGTLIPSLAVGVRRLHDTNKSGWFILLAFIPCVGLVLLVFFVIEGDKGTNQYGPDPKKGERTALADDDYDDRRARPRDDRGDFDDDVDDRPARRPTR